MCEPTVLCSWCRILIFVFLLVRVVEHITCNFVFLGLQPQNMRATKTVQFADIATFVFDHVPL